MPGEFFDIRSTNLDGQAECDWKRKVQEAETAARSTIERERRVIADRRVELEEQVAAEEDELLGIKEAALALQEEVSRARRGEGGADGQSLVEMWPELEEASAASRQSHADLTAARQRGLEEAEAQQQRLEQDRGLFQMYTATTGIHWDHESQHTEGYVGLAKARHFCLESKDGEDGKPEDPAVKAAKADALWQEIEASLGSPPADTDRPPWEAVPGGA